MKQLRFTLFIFAILFCGGFLKANDAPLTIIWQGSVIPMDKGHKSIRMESELVKIYLFGGYYQVVASFDFVNYGDSTTVIMGFPGGKASYESDIAGHKIYPNPRFSYIKSYVEGIEVELTERVTLRNDIYFDYYTKTVKFEKNQKKNVVVYYTQHYIYSDSVNELPSEYGNFTEGLLKMHNESTQEFEYNFTGGNWYKDVGYSKLIIYPKVKFQPKLPLPEGLRKEGENYIFEKYNWQAEYRFSMKGLISNQTLDLIFDDEVLVETKEAFPFEYSGIHFYYYVFKDYFGEVKYVSPFISSFSPYFHLVIRPWPISSRNFYTLELRNKEGSDKDFFYEMHIFNFKKSYQPRYIFKDIQLSWQHYSQLCLICSYVGTAIYYYVRDFNDTLNTLITKDTLSLLSANAKALDSNITNNYKFIDKLFTPGEYIDNLEAYVLQMIFINREGEAWKYFDDHFPFLCSKQKSKERILATKQKIFDFKID